MVHLLVEFSSGKSLKVGPSMWWLLSRSSQALPVEVEDVPLQSRKTRHCEPMLHSLVKSMAMKIGFTLQMW